MFAAATPAGILAYVTTDKPADRQAGVSARRPRDLVISLLVLLVPVLVLVGGYQILAGRTQPVEIDPAPAITAARADGMAVRAPDGPAGWVPISAVYAQEGHGGTVRIGYVRPDGGSAQLIQSGAPADLVLAAVLPAGATPAGTVAVAGQPWQHYTAGSGEQALVWLEPELTMLVIGRMSDGELAELAAAVS